MFQVCDDLEFLAFCISFDILFDKLSEIWAFILAFDQILSV
jgi:hypothetical protein